MTVLRRSTRPEESLVIPTPLLDRWIERAERGARARSELAIRNLNPQLVVEGLMLDLRG